VTEPASPIAARARADYLAGRLSAARRALETAPDFDLDAAALLALCWVRQVLSDRPHGACVDAAVLQAALAAPLDDPRLEADRQFALGWLHWLAGAPDQAEPLLAAAAQAPPGDSAEAAYWLARVRLGLGRAEAVADYERALRSLPASPQATCGFVDLLWRSGQLERAEGVWKTVRGSRRVTACDEAPLLEARALLRRDETTAAERALADANPRGGVAQVERLLLLAWVAAARGQVERAADYLRQAEAGPYPPAALQSWQRLFQLRRAPEPDWPEAPRALADWVTGQRARSEGRHDEALVALQALSAGPLRPFARYALACLGHDDFAAVLAGQPGWFLAQRCRARLALGRFCRREAAPGELVEALQQSEAAGYRLAGAEHYRRLALALKQRNPHADDLCRLADAPGADGEAAARNALRAAAELAARLLPPAEALALLLDWVRQGRVQADDVLRGFVGRQLLRLLLSCPPGACDPAEVLRTAESLVGRDPALGLVREWLGGADGTATDGTEAMPLVRLWRAAQALRDGVADPHRWRDEVAEVRAHAPLRGVAQCLLLREAAGRRDVAAVVALLDDVDAWRGFAPGPPRLAVDAVAALAGAAAAHPRWRAALARLLQVWDLAALGPGARPLAVRAGLVRLDAAAADVPAGLPAVRWLLHQAAQAVLRDDAREALAWVRRAQASDADLAGAGEQAEAVRAALPDLERLARAQLLADVIRLDPGQPPVAPRLLADAVAGLEADPGGSAVLGAAERGDLPAARQALAEVAGRRGLAPRLAHHLAVVYHRAALFFEEQERPDDAEACWRRAWPCWLRLLASSAQAVTGDHPLLSHLLGIHRRRVSALLARDRVETARRHWALVQELPDMARPIDGALARALAESAARFREELATEYLVATREAMRYGPVAEGWRADYDKGLAGLTRLLSLDKGNVRLLTALVETCNDYFHDCYVNEDTRRLWEGVERYTPFALQLALLADRRRADLTARAGLAEFYKFRGFVAPERERKVALFREALGFDPRNANVRELLEEAEKPREARR
jgi:tetratricopeptide (TPR) repeat protein